MLIPVCNLMFDRKSASACIAELGALARLAVHRTLQIGRCGHAGRWIHHLPWRKHSQTRSSVRAHPGPKTRQPDARAQESLVRGSRLCVFSPSQPLAHAAANTLPMTRLGHEAHNLDAPRFLLRQL